MQTVRIVVSGKMLLCSRGDCVNMCELYRPVISGRLSCVWDIDELSCLIYTASRVLQDGSAFGREE